MIFERYLFKNLLIATLFVTIILAAIIMLTQSLRFLELVINAGASSAAFWILTSLALPRFFSVILPIALLIAIIFIYNKMTIDSELVVMRATGSTPFMLAKPALYLAMLITLLLWVIAGWIAPLSQNNMEQLRQVVKAQYSSFLFREGVFNAVYPGLTVYVRDRLPSGEMQGVLIHDSRDENIAPVTIFAERGVIIANDSGQQVVVYNGTRQDFNDKTNILNRLNFERYTIDLPDTSGPVRQRWQEPSERTFPELFQIDPEDKRDMENRREFIVEINSRLIGPVLALSYAAVSLAFLLLGPFQRRGQGWRISGAIFSAIAIQGLYLGALSMARDANAGLIIMYILVIVPAAVSLFLLSNRSEAVRRALFFKTQRPSS